MALKGSEMQRAAKPRESERLTRRRLDVYDRVKVLALLGIFGAIGALGRTSANPVMSWEEAVYLSYVGDWWLGALLIAEVVRQAHFFTSEQVAAYNRFWRDGVFARFDRRAGRMDPWRRFRLARAWRFFVGITAAAVLLGSFTNRAPLDALLAVPMSVWQRLPFVLQLVVYMFMAIAQFAALFWFLSRGGVEVYMPDEIQTRFSDIWGQDHVIAKVHESLVFLEQPELVEQIGGYVPSGILLWGPPGTGKTLIAEAVAGETGKPYVFVDPGAFTNMFVGVGILKVKGLFRKLRKLALRHGGVIVFFDEADSLGNRGQLAPGGWRPNSETVEHGGARDRWLTPISRAALGAQHRGPVDQVVVGMGGSGGMGTLQALLTEMQGLKKPRGMFSRTTRKLLGMRPKQPPKYRILIVMATNMPDALDEALLRPGRIDRIYKVGYPTKEGRRRTYEGYLAKVPHNLNAEDLDKLASMTPPRTGAEIKDLVNEALIHAMREGRGQIEWRDVLHARYLRQTGLPEGFVYVDWERHGVAVHEACHAVAAAVLRPWHPIDVATIERRGDIGGFVSSFDTEEQFAQWRNDFEADVCVSLASLAGEKLFFGGDNSAGVGGDLQNATALVYRMLGVYGMGASISSLAGRPGGALGDITAGANGHLDALVEVKLSDLYERVRDLLEDRRNDVLAVAHALEVHKTITGEDVLAILGGWAGPNLDGGQYHNDRFRAKLEQYHEAAVKAHWSHDPVAVRLPDFETNTVELGGDDVDVETTAWGPWRGEASMGEEPDEGVRRDDTDGAAS